MIIIKSSQYPNLPFIHQPGHTGKIYLDTEPPQGLLVSLVYVFYVNKRPAMIECLPYSNNQ